ncbi:hypothetical protein [Metabacillus litoralis]|uniref:hypothetical protein n=1 Tax=Metabacillus litoralis TaxID=152268 RepID=UPI001CFE149B|nr:hypothetical protein [Metabacillus litoralis]
MVRKKTKLENPTITIIYSILGILLGFSGVYYLFNGQGFFDLLMGISLIITGFIGGVLGLIQYLQTKTRRT